MNDELTTGCVAWADGREEHFPGPVHQRQYREWTGGDGHIYQTMFEADSAPTNGILYYRQRGTKRVEPRRMTERQASDYR